MHCSSCAKLIKMKLDKLDGVMMSEVSDTNKQAIIEYDPTKVKVEDLINIVAGLGYLAKELK